MTLPAPMDLTSWFESRVEDFLLLTPTSTSPQPVHVLNGFLHHSLTGRRAPKTGVDLVAARQGVWAETNAKLRDKTPLKLPTDDLKLDKARRAVGALIAADRAVFATFASFQVAHLGLVTSDGTHHRLGELASRVARARKEGLTAIDDVVARLAKPQPNPHWAIEAVLSEPGVLDDVKAEDPPDGDWWWTNPDCAQLASDMTDLMIRCLRLCASSADALLGLETLAVTATWIGLLTYVQVPSLGLGQGLAPLLCQASEPGELPSVRSTSQVVVDQVDHRFRDWVAHLLTDELTSLFGDEVPEGDDAVKFAQESAPTKKLSGGRIHTPAEIEEIYRAWIHDQTPLVALAQTLAILQDAAMGNKARDWFSAVGRHCGFVGPRRGRNPRLRAEVSLIPTLLLAGIAEDDPAAIPFDTWLSRLASRFGILFGPHEESHRMSPRASEHDLLENQASLAALLTSLGVARRYSDGVTEVLNPFELWGAS